MTTAHILVVDDEPEICRLLREILEDENYSVTTAGAAAEARTAYKRHLPDLVLLDIWLPDTDGITLLKEWTGAGAPEIPVIMISGHGTVETAVEAVRLGAQDFIEKPLSTGKLLVTIERVLRSERLRKENLRLRSRAEPLATLVGKSAAMQSLREQIERIAAHDGWVLITGEPGAGKAVAARYLHNRSARKDHPLVEISLAAVSPESVPARLFGTESGEELHAGSFEQAHGGTLVLDEVADLDAATQARLLNALEDKRFMRVGGKHAVEIDVRIVATTNQDLGKAVAAGSFREDLYYRLNVLPIHIPALREHREDVPELIGFYVDWFVEKEHLGYRRFTTAAINRLRNYEWPGNVRELRNLVQRLLILRRGEEVTADEIEQALGQPTQSQAGAFSEQVFALPLREARDVFEKAYLEHHLRRTDGNVAEVASVAQMERTHLYRKLKGLGISPKSLRDDS